MGTALVKYETVLSNLLKLPDIPQRILLLMFCLTYKSVKGVLTLYSTCMQHDMPQSLLVFAVSFTPETTNVGTFGGVAHSP